MTDIQCDPPPALGGIDVSDEGQHLLVAAARHVGAVMRNRGLSPAERVQALLLVAADIASDVPPDQLVAAQSWFCWDAAARWYHAVAYRNGLAAMPPAGSA